MDELLDPAALLWRASWQGAVLAVAVLGLTRILGRWLTPAWRYGLWLVVLVRLALPVLPTASWSVWRLADPQPMVITAPAPVPPVQNGRPVVSAKPLAMLPSMAPIMVPTMAPFVPAGPESFPWKRLLSAVWLMGSIACGAWCVAAWWRLHRRIATAVVPTDERLAEALARAAHTAGLARVPMLREIPGIAGPAAFGVLRPVLLLPCGLAHQLDDQELDDALLHECTHLRRGDVAVVWLGAAVQCLHWWNPLVWLAMRRLRAAQELSCDASALSRTGAGRHARYAASLVRLAACAAGLHHPHLAAGASGARRDLMERIAMIHQPTTPSRRLLATGALLTATTAGLVLMDAPPRMTAGEPTPSTPSVAVTPAAAPRIDITPAVEVPAWHRQLQERLQQRVTVDFEDKGLDEVVHKLREMSGMNIIMVGQSENKVSLKVKDMQLRYVLDFVAKITSMHVELRDGAVALLAAPDPAVLEARLYDLAPLGPGDRTELLALINEVLHLDRNPGSLALRDQVLIARLPAEQQGTVLSLLQHLASGQEVGMEPAPWVKEYRDKLEQQLTVNFDGIPLLETIEFLKRVTDLNVIVDPELISGSPPDVSLKVETMPLKHVLGWICTASGGLSWQLRDESLFISKGDCPRARRIAIHRLQPGKAAAQELQLDVMLSAFLPDPVSTTAKKEAAAPKPANDPARLRRWNDMLVAEGDEDFHEALKVAIQRLRGTAAVTTAEKKVAF